jgi:putative glutamine amidotransferase
MKGFMAHRPRIGITMRLELETHRFYLGRDYSEVLEACGAIPFHLSLIPKQEYISEALSGLDGILLPGSNTDIDPHYYGEDPHHRLGTVIPVKDETDRLVLEEVERQKMPLLAICYGMQALNVFRGGTLIQDIESQLEGTIKHEQGYPATRTSHKIMVAQGSILSDLEAFISSNGDTRVNSSHHQAIGRVGNDLEAIAWASDGVIECITDVRDDRFAVGVQWHPELTAGHDKLSREIFELFVERCRASKQGNI